MVTNKINIVIVSNDEEYAQAMQVRRDVFVTEQKISPQKEFDGNDHSATHVLAIYENKPIGTMRIRYFNGFVKMERMCVIKDFRKTDASELIMQKGIDFVAQKGYEMIYGICKKELLNRWRRDGFEKIPDTPVVEQNGMTLVPVCCKINKPDKYITIQTSADIINAKEGEWFDHVEENAVNRIKNLTDKVRKIKDAENPHIEQTDKSFVKLLHKTDDKTY